MIEGSRTRVVVGVAAVAVGWKHRATLLSYATLPARAFVGVARAWCRGERHAGPGSRVVAAAVVALGPEGTFARDRPAAVLCCGAVAGVSVLSLLDRAVAGRVRKALNSETCRRAVFVGVAASTGVFCALEAYAGYGVRSPATTHVLTCLAFEGVWQAAMVACTSPDFKKKLHALEGHLKSVALLALNVLHVKGQSPVERGGIRCFTAFLGFSAVQVFEEIWGVEVVVPVARAGLKMLILADHALARVLRHVVRPVVLAGANALVFCINRIVKPTVGLVGRVMNYSYGILSKPVDAFFDYILAPAGRAVRGLWSRVAYPTARGARWAYKQIIAPLVGAGQDVAVPFASAGAAVAFGCEGVKRLPSLTNAGPFLTAAIAYAGVALVVAAHRVDAVAAKQRRAAFRRDAMEAAQAEFEGRLSGRTLARLSAVLERIGVALYKHADMGLIDLAVAVAARLAKPLGRALGVCLKLLVLSFEVADSVFSVTMMALHAVYKGVRRAVGTAASFVSDAVVSIWKNPFACLLFSIAALAVAYFAHDRGVEIDARAKAMTVFGPVLAVASRLLAALRRTAGAARGLVTAALAPRPAYVYFKSWRFAMTVAVPHLVTSTVLRVLGVSKAPIIDSIGTASSKCVLLPVFVLSAANRMVVARVFVGLVQILVLPILLLYFWCALGVFLYEVHQRAQTLSELSDMRAGRAKATAETATVDALVASLATPARVVPAKDCGICLAPLNVTEPFALPCGHQFHNDCARDWVALKREEACCPYCRVNLFS